ncbi:MAG: PrgI family protein [Candidatus Parcubacteria bacterium]|nr:PrgI family protein [Candidatus Parcubacteria bacterium]
MQYHVPQFLEVEDKIFGQLTFKQFLYIIGGAGLAYLAYTYLPIYISIFIILAVIAFSISLAFIKINNKPFIVVVDSFLRYIISPRLYIWKKMPNKKTKEEADRNKTATGVYIPPLTAGNLKDLAWSLDIKQQQEVKNNQPTQKKSPLLKDI